MIKNFVQVGAHKIQYLESGTKSKRALVLIHGLGASAERWEHVIPDLSKRYRVIAPDLPGFGHSDKPSLEYTPQFFAKFLHEFLDTVGVNSCTMIGSSLGGQVVAEYAITYKTKLEKIILVSPAGVMKQPTESLREYITAALYPNHDTAYNAFKRMAGNDEKVPHHVIDDFVKRMSLPNAKMAFASTLLGLKNADVISQRLHDVSVPSLVIWGENDNVIPIKYASDFVSSLRDCKYIKMENCGHTPYTEDPRRFVDNVVGFIDHKDGLVFNIETLLGRFYKIISRKNKP